MVIYHIPCSYDTKMILKNLKDHKNRGIYRAANAEKPDIRAFQSLQNYSFEPVAPTKEKGLSQNR